MLKSTPNTLGRDRAVLAGVLARQTDLVLTSGAGSWVTDESGRRFLDFACGIAVTNLGHCHPAVVAAIQRQAATLMHTSVVAHHTPVIEAAERLAERTGFINNPHVFFCNSGAEAVDGALKLVRRVTGRPEIIAFEGGFHGRTLAATTLTTAKAKYREGYEPLLEGVRFEPYGSGQINANAGAVIVEPVLGEGGYYVADPQWLAGLRRSCDESGALLIFDEIQTGAGRTGHFFAAETFGVYPDILLFAKGVANGLPIGGIIASAQVMDAWPPGTHGSTFGGNPVACAAAVATMDEISNWLPRVRSKSVEILNRLRALPVVETRGIGYMFGIEFADGSECAAVRARCLDAGLITLSCGRHDHVLRLIPPLNASDEEIEIGVDILESSIKEFV